VVLQVVLGLEIEKRRFISGPVQERQTAENRRKLPEVVHFPALLVFRVRQGTEEAEESCFWRFFHGRRVEVGERVGFNSPAAF